MRKIIYLILVGITVNSTHAQTLPIKHEWHATLKVIDEAGKPIAEANASIGYYTNSVPTSADGLTDTNGIFSASHSAYSGLLGFTAEKPGYYITRKGYDLGFTYDFARWNPTQTIILKKKINPIPMYAKEQELKFPKEDEAIGFDLMAGDWVTPYGKGFHADIFFTVHRKIINEREYDCTLTMIFPNKGDGIGVAPTEPDTDSEFKTSRTALENGYEPELDLHYTHSKRPDSVFGYFIRVRTELDQDGNIRSALYGKIKGNFRFYAGTIAPTAGMGFDYYLNPTPNDRNVEFDPKQNLMKNLKPLEGVSEP
jgi:hypothetical protein